MFNTDRLRIEIENLIREYPDLANDEILRADMLEAETDILAALTELFRAVDDNKMMVEAITLRLQELTGRRSRFARRVDFLRELMLRILQAADLRKVELAEATLSQRASPPRIVGEINPDALPDDLVRVKREANGTAIREALQAHREIPGLALSNAPPSLMIKAK